MVLPGISIVQARGMKCSRFRWGGLRSCAYRLDCYESRPRAFLTFVTQVNASITFTSPAPLTARSTRLISWRARIATLLHTHTANNVCMDSNGLEEDDTDTRFRRLGPNRGVVRDPTRAEPGNQPAAVVDRLSHEHDSSVKIGLILR